MADLTIVEILLCGFIAFMGLLILLCLAQTGRRGDNER